MGPAQARQGHWPLDPEGKNAGVSGSLFFTQPRLFRGKVKIQDAIIHPACLPPEKTCRQPRVILSCGMWSAR